MLWIDGGQDVEKRWKKKFEGEDGRIYGLLLFTSTYGKSYLQL
jgi:hypothetical protein